MATLSETYKAILGVEGVTSVTGDNRVNTVSYLLSNQPHYYQGLGGNDFITGGLGNDYIEGGAGADRMVGGTGQSTLGYLNSDAFVTVTLDDLGGLRYANGGHATGDVSLGALLVGFENLVGSDFGDVLTGNASANIIIGMGGDDDIFGGGGNDVLYGGDGVDTIYGGLGDDKIYGEAGNDQLFGDEGNDTFYFSSQNNAMDGEAGTGDTVDYSKLDRSAEIDLTPGTDGLGHGGQGAVGDTYKFIENVFGSEFGDTIWGNASVNIMDGKGGRDVFFYKSVADLKGDTINQFFANRQDDRINLSILDITFGDIAASSIFGDHTVVYTITDDGQTGSLTVQFGELVSGVSTVFIV